MFISKCKIIARKVIAFDPDTDMFCYVLESDRSFEIAYSKTDFKVGQTVTLAKSYENGKWKTKIC